MPFSVLDLVVLGIVVVSALLAAVRGVTREVLAIIAWVAAAAVAWSLYPMLLPTVKQHVTSDTVALVASIAAIFLGTLIVVSIITVKISDVVLDSRIGAIDRSLGFLFGAARGFLICVIGWVFLSWLVQGKVPTWAAEARTRPMLEKSGDALVAQLPENPEGFLKQFKKPKVDTPQNEPVDAPAETEVPPRQTTPAVPAPRR
ncbi:CvpA family protein [Methylobacterium sp. E-041]|jgi:membrane protein required for colicin V production|uniref:CvpA family protein n=1 Tax=unclassified Methylobacterium TaxID=2615210 RepID=UPI0011C94D91|nr:MULTISPECIES: CvpA family protein [unclassified Methylobacterium]MCJ2006215.1 CvpA family protein [Methylobacterium sp. J-092]MCJ2104223.1 CvpA family protein [Methylobacterium sp. E-041]MCJ2110349.1 CvpA family protein [Methylobacterium sp. E-025]TXN71538.1 CvpA family protein [Methylobacterium sp. WL6]